MRWQEKQLKTFSRSLSETRLRSVWLYHGKDRTVWAIAVIEHVCFQCVHKSIQAAETKVARFLKIEGRKMP